MKKNLLNDPRAVSLIFAIVIMTIIMVTAGSMADSNYRARQRELDAFRSTQAYYAARASMEKAIAAVSANADTLVSGYGYEDSVTESIQFDTNGDSVNDTSGDYEMVARSKPLDWQDVSPSVCGDGVTECFIPIPGTGDAGADCDFEDVSQNWFNDADDSCNWNKIQYQDTVTIPFYYEDATCTGSICNPAELLMANFILRIRTPSGQILAGDEDTVIVNWEFSGECDTDGDAIGDESCYMVAYVDPSRPQDDTRLTSAAINDEATSGNQVLTGDHFGKDDLNSDPTPTIIEFLESPWDGYWAREIINPELKLSVISPLIEDVTGDSIPYLEYQIITDQEISDNKIVYTADGKAEGKLGTYVQHIRATQAIGSSAVINFAVQN